MKIRTLVAPLLLAMLVVPAVPAVAQGPEGAGPDRRAEMLFKGITLTEGQQARIDSLQARHRAQAGPMERGSMPEEGARAARREQMRKHYAEIRALLTSEQQPLFDRNVEAMMAARPRRPPSQ